MEFNLQMSKNAPCQCHSGEKYKACCMGKLSFAQEQYFALLNKERIIKDKLISWIMSNLTEDEIDDYCCSFNGRKYKEYKENKEKISFLDWMFLEAKRNDRLLTQFILEDSPEIFDAVEIAIIKEWIANTSPGIFEVLYTSPDEWKFDMKEAFAKKEYEVIDRLASKNFVRGDIIYAKVQNIFSKHYMSGVGKIIPRDQLSHLETFIKSKMSEHAKGNPEMTYELFMKSHGNEMNKFKPVMPGLINSSGEEICLSEIEYSFDPGKIDQILDMFLDNGKYIIAEIDYPKSGFKSAEIGCLAKKREFQSGEPKIMLANNLLSRDGEAVDTEGSISIKKGKLRIFSNSKERAGKIRKVLEKTGYFKLQNESYLSGEDALKRAAENLDLSNNEGKKKILSLETEKLFSENYYKDWCRQKIPALGNIAPKEALKTGEGKEMLKKLLLDFENEEEHKKKNGKKFVSAVEIIRKELDFYE